MNTCATCGDKVLFGGIAVGTTHFCNQACRERYETAVRLPMAVSIYKQCLARLRHDPSNPVLRQETLAAGRAYVLLARRSQGQGGALHVFDEVALSNDIAAACAAASAPPAASPTVSQSPEQRLERLDGLRRKALISEEEYQRKRTAILDEV